jgi:hypothetical protein
VKDLMRTVYKLALEEGVQLDQIYLNEGGNASAPAYVDVDYATTAELADAITTLRELQAFVDGSAAITAEQDRRARFATFLQDRP